MSKTFEGVDGIRLLHIKNLGKHVTMSIEVPGQVHIGITFDPASIPALALAELEAAATERQVIVSAEMADTLQSLRGEVRRIDERTAAVRELAELEAEAFKLRRAYLEGRAGFDSWNELTDAERDHWLAVARKAREMRVAG